MLTQHMLAEQELVDSPDGAQPGRGRSRTCGALHPQLLPQLALLGL